jgi:chromosome segregation ATPase
MNEAEIKKILAYCEKVDNGPWGKTPSDPKTIVTNPKGKSDDQKSICTLMGATPTENWSNYHFIVNASRDLPALAKDCMEMLDLIERATKQLELSREKKQWIRLKNANRQLKLEQSEKRLELAKTSQRHFDLEEENNRLQLDITRKQTELQSLTTEYQASLMEKQAQLEQARLQHQQEIQNKQAQMEQATQKLGEELKTANTHLETAINHIRKQDEDKENEKDDFYGSESNKEGIAGLLGKLDTIEAYMEAPTEISKIKKESPISDPEDEEPQEFNQEMLNELTAIGEIYDPRPEEKHTPAATKTDLAATANEFALEDTTELTQTELTQSELTETA